MKKQILSILLISLLLITFNLKSQINTNDNKDLALFFDRYYGERMQLMPLLSTFNGDSTNNDKLYADFTDSYRAKLKDFYKNYLIEIQKFNREALNENDKLSFDIFKRTMEITLEGLSLGYYLADYQYIPFAQISSLPNFIVQLGSGDGAQPFKTVKDYDNWLLRATAFWAWADSAIIYFRKGISANIVLPEVLVVKTIPQLDSIITSDATKSLFYKPINKMPKSFNERDRIRITSDYLRLINEQLTPAYIKLSTFLKTEYLPKARNTAGIGAFTNGNKYYSFLIKYQTTTDKSADEIYQTGLSEVKRIRLEMDSLKNVVGFKGNLTEFFQFLATDKQFMPFKTPEEVLDAYRSIQSRIDPYLKNMFNHFPKTKFEIRQTEAFRAASASPQYYGGTPDGKRPGIFYVPIMDATMYNSIRMEALFLHEAIPGHHYQRSLQKENQSLPMFRRFGGTAAYGEGWALYTESLGNELGLYTDPYQQFGALVTEIHRAIRLVVDVGIHCKNMTREQAILYMMENRPIDNQFATSEVERYMANPAQALSYKIGELKIKEIKKKCQQKLSGKFNLAAFHDEFLKDGDLPLEILEKKMDTWAEGQLKRQ